MPHAQPQLADLRRTAEVFNGFTGVDKSWLRLLADTAPAVDLSFAEHRTLLLRWLNSWGCRISYPSPDDPFDSALLLWWQTYGSALPQVSLAGLSDAEITTIARAYESLAAVTVSSRRTLSATAAAKALYALRPDTVMPWDAAIAKALHGSRTGAAFEAHLRLGRSWAQAVLAACPGQSVPDRVGRPAVSLAKILDEYLYVTITMPGGQTNGHRG
ncbi:hypothetical protein JOF56_006769 [Kibdelosporangium banguiense]|uniref:Uncharacterized protein n=1 Tax=Kibdelosporangium banguiense TaxID=1365924 RepID=A0ABS4TPR0_9PSEU|nr:hypothetical protein [Kibdelosporangium banguiense]MBP2326384.1 hypothetical protein [Kibdelosporangium banguiense]